MTRFRYGLTLSAAVLLTLALSTFAVAAENTADHDWPQWRGPNRDGIGLDTGLLKVWPKDGPPLLYCFKGDDKGLGDGYASPSIVGNHAYISGKFGGDAYLMGFELPDPLPAPTVPEQVEPPARGQPQKLPGNLPYAGKLLWKTKFGKSCGSGENSTPTVVGDRIYLTSGDGDIAGFDTSGKLLWVHNMRKDFNARIQTNSGYGFSEAPLVDGDKVIVCPGTTDAVMVAYNKETGELLWKAVNPGGRPKDGTKEEDPASHCSVVISNACGIKQYVNNVGWGLIGVSTDGKFLWGYKKWAESSCNTPIVKDDYVFGANAYGFGAILLKLESDGTGGITPTVVYSLNADKTQTLYGQMVLLGDSIYIGHGQYGGIPQCIDFLTGKKNWQAQKIDASGEACLISCDGMLIYRIASKPVLLVEATPKGYNLVSSFVPACHREGAYSLPVVAHGLMYLRDRDVVMVYDLRRHPLTE